MSSPEYDVELCASLKSDDTQALESIYPDYIVEFSENFLRLEIPVELGTPREVILPPSLSPLSRKSNTSTYASYTATTTSLSPSATLITLKLAHLPPVLLDLFLPDGYPLVHPPTISSLNVRQGWIPSEGQLAQVLLNQWSEGESVLCTWVELIRSGDFLNNLKLINGSGAICLPCPDTLPPSILRRTLLAYDAHASSAEFSKTSFSCSICFTSLKGAHCIQLSSCSHVFCVSCLQDFWGLCIEEGSVERVGCADPECVKVGREASEEEVRRVCGEKAVIRWKWLKTKKAIEKDPTIVHCPIPTCQAPVPKPPTDPKESSGWDRFRTCPECDFSFCSFCKHTWHGPIAECPKSVTLALIMEYLDLPEGSPERATLERKFGKGVIIKLVKEYEDEESTNAWIENSTTACPNCKIPVEKSMGCNHMMCAKCLQHFCYRCAAKLDANNPYSHFSAKGGPCYGKLFDLVRDDNDWQAIQGFEVDEL